MTLTMTGHAYGFTEDKGGVSLFRIKRTRHHIMDPDQIENSDVEHVEFAYLQPGDDANEFLSTVEDMECIDFHNSSFLSLDEALDYAIEQYDLEDD